MWNARGILLAMAIAGAVLVGGCKDDTGKSNSGAPSETGPSGRPSATQPAEEPTTGPAMPGGGPAASEPAGGSTGGGAGGTETNK